jgi:hypothetical protein
MDYRNDPTYKDIVNVHLPRYRRKTDNKFSELMVGDVVISESLGNILIDGDTVIVSPDILGLDLLSDPGADRFLFWDESVDTLSWGTFSDGLELTGTTLKVKQGNHITVNSGGVNHNSPGTPISPAVTVNTGGVSTFVKSISYDVYGHITGYVTDVLNNQLLRIKADAATVNNVNLVTPDTFSILGGTAIDTTISGTSITVTHENYITAGSIGSATVIPTIHYNAQGHITNVTANNVTIVPTSRTITINGTANRITSSAGAQDLTNDRTWNLDIASTYVGQTSITTLGTITTGTVPAPRVSAGTFGAGDYRFQNSVLIGGSSNNFSHSIDDSGSSIGVMTYNIQTQDAQRPYFNVRNITASGIRREARVQVINQLDGITAILSTSPSPSNEITTAYVGTSSNHNFSLGANLTSRIFITTGGNVGIDVSNPLEKFHTAGRIRYSTNTSSMPTALGRNSDGVIGDLLIGNINPGSGISITGGTGKIIGSDVIITNNISPGGGIVFTGTNPIVISSSMSVAGTTNYVSKYLSSSSLGNSQIFDNGTNVGINTNNPTLARLHVAQSVGTSPGSAIRFGERGFLVSTTTTLSDNAYFNGTAWASVNTAQGSTQVFLDSNNFGISNAIATTGVPNWVNRFYINSSGEVGIGTTSPSGKLQVLVASADSIVNITRSTSSTSNLQLRAGAEFTGVYSQSSPDVNTGRELRFYMGTTNYRMRLSAAGQLDVLDDIVGKSTALSDIRAKNLHGKITNPFDIINKLNGYNITWKETNKFDYAIIAQEVQEVYPHAVSLKSGFKRHGLNEYLTVNHSAFVPLFIEGLKEHDIEINKLKEEVKQLRYELSRLSR